MKFFGSLRVWSKRDIRLEQRNGKWDEFEPFVGGTMEGSWRGVVWLLLVVFVVGNNITAYQSKVNKIFTLASSNEIGYERLEYLCNTFGSRITGSEALESAIDWIVSEMSQDGFDSVTTENVAVPHVRIQAFCVRFSLNLEESGYGMRPS